MTTVRLAREGDFRAVCEIVNHYIRTTTINFRTEDQSPADWVATWQDGRDRYPWLVAERDGEIAGLAYAGAWNARAAYGWTAEVTGYVAPGLRRDGVGRALYATLLGTLDAQGYRTALAVIALPNAASAGFHESFGFVPAGVLRNVGHKLGRWCDVGLWQRHAPDPPAAATPVLSVRAHWRTPE
jgi:phosphinothricin acetyltransferase